VPHPGEKGLILKWFGFSMEGMIFSKDSGGNIRAYSLEANEWTHVLSENSNDNRKTWIIGFKEYCMVYWKTTETEPEPTVRPRLV
jgi:hypothetical protein